MMVNMDSLQVGLAILGAGVLVLMLAYYLWVSRGQNPRREKTLLDDPSAASNLEPTLDVVASVATPESTDFALPVPEKKPTLDALLDAIAPIALDASVSGEAILAALPPTRRVGSKPFAVEGLNATSACWETPRAGQRYQALQAGVQLANRSGALNDIEFSEFVIETQRFCDAVGGTPDFPDMRSEVARARELDQFASAHDAQIGFVLRARRAAWSAGYIQQMAARLGLLPGALAGRMVLPASTPGAPAIFSLSYEPTTDDEGAQQTLRDVNLALDVPLVDRQELPFARLCEVAIALARDMDGVITDDNGVALPGSAMDVIAAELEQLYDTLAQHEFEAGSALARRLFS